MTPRGRIFPFFAGACAGRGMRRELNWPRIPRATPVPVVESYGVGSWQYVTIGGRRTAVQVCCGPAAHLPDAVDWWRADDADKESRPHHRLLGAAILFFALYSYAGALGGYLIGERLT